MYHKGSTSVLRAQPGSGSIGCPGNKAHPCTAVSNPDQPPLQPLQQPSHGPQDGLAQQDGFAPQDGFAYEPVERFGESMTTAKPWNRTALQAVELLNGRVAMLGFAAAIVGELLTGEGMVGQLGLILRWYLN